MVVQFDAEVFIFRLQGEDVVERLMCAVAGAEVVAAVVEDVAALAAVRGGIVAGQEVFVDIHGDVFILAGGDIARLIKTYQRDGGFFHQVLAVVVGVRRLYIDLYGRFALHLARVGHADGDGKLFARGAVCLELCDLITEGGIREAEPEREGDLFGIVPAAGACKRTRLRIGVVAAEHAVFVPCFIILVADVDALRLHEVFAGDVDQTHVFQPHLRRVGIGIVAEVLCRRRRERIGSVCVDQPARRIGRARQDICHALHAVLAGGADPQGGVDAVLLVIQPAQLQRIAAVDQQDDGIEVLVRHLQGVLFVGMQRQLADAVDIFGQKVVAFARIAGEDDDGGVIVAVKRRDDVIRKEVRVLFADVAGHLVAVFVAGGIGVVYGVVDGEPRPFQRRLQGDAV